MESPASIFRFEYGGGKFTFMSLTLFSSGNYRILHALGFAANSSVVRYGMTLHLIFFKKVQKWRNGTLGKSAFDVLLTLLEIYRFASSVCRSQLPRGLRRRSTAARLLGLWVRIPPGGWMFVWCECCVLSGRGPCDKLITLPEESYRLWCVVVCDLETSWMRRPWEGGSVAPKKEQKQTSSV